MVENIELLIDLYVRSERLGPGGDAETDQAIRLAGIDPCAPLKVADIGCGTGASTLRLARLLKAEIVAVDFFQGFIDALKLRAQSEGLEEKISPLCASMEQLPFEEEAFDVIWSEGAIYNIGFEKGVAEWKRYLKPGGMLVVSEISWLTNSRPPDLQAHWGREYPEIDTASAKIKSLEENGYTPAGYFILPEYCWLDNFYEPMRNGFDAFLRRNGRTEEAQSIVEAARNEIAIYEKYKSYFSYGVYIAKKFNGEGK